MKIFKLNILILILLFSQSCTNNRKFPEVQNLSNYNNTEFIQTLESKFSNEKNAVYSASLLYSWNEIRNILKPPFQIKKEFKELKLLNSSKSFVAISQNDEYMASGNIIGKDITLTASFKKSLAFKVKMESFDNNLIFNETLVPAFGMLGKDDNIAKTIKILYYKNDDNFIVKLFPKDTEHEIILIKINKRFKTMQAIIAEIEKKEKVAEKQKKKDKFLWKYYFQDNDELLIPKFSFNIETGFKNLNNSLFVANNEEYYIDSTYQRTAFILDEIGTEIESEALMFVKSTEALEEIPKQKKLHFNKDFFIMLKRVDTRNPYFAMWVANTELMTH